MILRRKRLAPAPAPAFRELPAGGRVRCGIVTPALCQGGAERWILDLLRAVHPARVAWAGVALTLPGNQVPATVQAVEAFCPVSASPGAAAALAHACDVLLLWGIPGADRLLPKPCPARTVLVSHGEGDWTRRCFARCGWANALVAVSGAAVQPIPEPERGRARVIYNGVDPERVKPATSRAHTWRQWGLPEGRARALGFLGRFSPEKNPFALVDALPHLPAEWHAVLVGQGPLEEPLQERAHWLGVSSRLRLPGYVDPPGDALAAFDVLAVPSLEEGFPLVTAEAWLAGLPVLQTPTGIAVERPDLVGRLPPAVTGRDLARAVLSDAPAARVELAREWAAAHLTLSTFGAHWTALLTET